MIRLLIYILVLFHIFYTNDSLRWINSGFIDNSDTVIETSIAKSAASIDVSRGVQVTIIKNSVNFEYGIEIFCFISGYDTKSSIDFYFSKDKSDVEIKSGESREIDDFNHFKIKINASFPNKIGMQVSLSFSTNKVDHSGYYFCKAKNGNFAITSNYIEIRDSHYWGLNLFQTTKTSFMTEIKEITKGSLPQVLKCGDGGSSLAPNAPRWTKIEFPSPTYWAVCPILKADQGVSEKNKMSTAKCITYSKDKCADYINSYICPVDIKNMGVWTTFINQNGDLIFTEIRGSTANMIDSYSLMCYSKDKDSEHKAHFFYYAVAADRVITKGITFDETKTSNDELLVMISPEAQEFTLYAKQIPKDGDAKSRKPAIIYALYKGPEWAKSSWKFGSTSLNSNNNLIIGKYTVEFHGEITSKLAGRYSLDVVNMDKRISMVINVRVLGPPLLSMDSCMPPLHYKWAGEDIAIKCDYKQRPVDIKLQINSQEIKLGDAAENSKANLRKSHPYLERLNFTVTPNNYVETDNVEIGYTVYNLTKSLGQQLYQDHTVTILASNDFGISVKSSSIYVIPRLKDIVTEFPEKHNCTEQCTSLQEHRFRCDVRIEELANKELRVEHYWTINSHKLGNLTTYPINSFTPYFIVDPITKMLTMLPIKSDNPEQDKIVKDYLKDNNIECHVDIFPAVKADSSFEYYSNLDHSFGSKMKARITLDYVPISTAHIYWIMTLILALVVLIICLVFVARYCMQNKGETYQLDKLERKHGYDPDKEVQEEMFKPYERQENDPSTMPDIDDEKGSFTGHSVGSNDDGELDRYDLDPSNFNEDGSIIGKYGANPRNRAAMT